MTIWKTIIYPVHLASKAFRKARSRLRRARRDRRRSRERTARDQAATVLKAMPKHRRLPSAVSNGASDTRERFRWFSAALSPTYRAPRENDHCPACGSTALRMLGTLPLSRPLEGKRVGFIGGCSECGLVFSNPMPTAEELAAFYAPSGEFDERRTGEAAERAQRAGVARSKLRLIFQPLGEGFDILSPAVGSRVLDFGCGDGAFLNSLNDHGWETYGVEPSSDAAFTRHQQVKELPTEAQFDLVIVHHVLEHVRDPLHTLRAIATSMNEGAYIYVSVPRLDSIPQHMDLQYCIRSSGHIAAYTENCMQELMARVGIGSIGGLNTPAYDNALTQGRPNRMRLLGRRTSAPVAGPDRPLDAALRAFAGYRRRQSAVRSFFRPLVPVRLRASLANAARETHASWKRPVA